MLFQRTNQQPQQGSSRSDTDRAAFALVSHLAPHSRFHQMKPCSERKSRSHLFMSHLFMLFLRQLKPTCVALLSHSSTPGSPELPALLSRLRESLQSLSVQTDQPVLNTALIHYVFFPLAQLLRASPAGPHGLPDLVREGIFSCLVYLAADWWRVWSESISPVDGSKPQTSSSSGTQAAGEDKWQVWEQLLLLGAVALGGTPSPQKPSPTAEEPAAAPPSQAQSQKAHQNSDGKERAQPTATASSDESRLTIAEFLYALLEPRPSSAMTSDSTSPPLGSREKQAASSVQQWEWDGESDLPSLDDFSEESSSAMPQAVPEQKHAPAQLYPSRPLVLHALGKQATRGALAHTLTSALELACDTQAMLKLRLQALRLAHVLLHTWIAGYETPSDATKSGEQATASADRIALILPGVVSSLVRILSGRARATSDAPATTTNVPGELAGLAVDTLRDVLLLCLRDDVTTKLRVGLDSHSASVDVGSKRKDASKLEDFSELLQQAQDRMEDFHVSHEPTEEQATSAPTDASNRVSTSGTDKPQSASERTDRTPAWLRATVARVLAALHALSPLLQHQAAVVRIAIVNLSLALLTNCDETLAFNENLGGDRNFRIMALCWLLDLADEGGSSISVLKEAQAALGLVCVKPKVAETLGTVLHETIQSLPRSILSHEDRTILLFARRLVTIASLSSDSAVVAVSAIEVDVERWGPHLLSCLELVADEPMLISGPMSERVWTKYSSRDAKPSLLDSATSSGQHASPLRHAQHRRPRFIHIESPDAAQAIVDMLRALGRAAATIATTGSKSSSSRSPHLTTYFLHLGGQLRTTDANNMTKRSASALFVCDELLLGMAEVWDDSSTTLSKKARKAAHRLAKDVVNSVLDMWDEDQEDSLNAVRKSEREGERSILATDVTSTETEHVKGLDTFSQNRPTSPDSLAAVGPALDLNFVGAATINGSKSEETTVDTEARRRARAVAQVHLADSFLLSLLASSASLLGPSGFRPLLLRTLYPLISALTSSPKVQLAAQEALERIATACAYASVQSCVLDHADYVLGAASHRLISGLGPELFAHFSALPPTASKSDVVLGQGGRSPATLIGAHSAPLVLVEMIHMLGPEAVPLIEDAVDEVLDALDRYHGHDGLCSGLLAVLDGLVEVMVDDEREQEHAAKVSLSNSSLGISSSDAREKASAQIPAIGSKCSDPLVEMVEFEEWFTHRNDDLPEENDLPGANATEERATPAEAEAEDASPPPPTRSQEVVAQILAKAVPFLSHSSSFLRARVLRLLQRGVVVLAPQGREAELLPVIHRAWPFVLSRLGRSSTSLGGTNFSRAHSQGSTKRSAASDDLTEEEPYVWIEAAGLVESLARHVPEFMAKRIVDDAWPRLARLLELQTDGPQSGSTTSKPRHTTPTPYSAMLREPSELSHPISHTNQGPNSLSPRRPSSGSATAIQAEPSSRSPFRPDEHSVSYNLHLCILHTLSTVVEHLHLRLADEPAWQMAVHPILLGSLDAGQVPTLRICAERLYTALTRRNPDAVWLVLGGAAGRYIRATAQWSSLREREHEHERERESDRESEPGQWHGQKQERQTKHLDTGPTGLPIFLHRPELQITASALVVLQG